MLSGLDIALIIVLVIVALVLLTALILTIIYQTGAVSSTQPTQPQPPTFPPPPPPPHGTSCINNILLRRVPINQCGDSNVPTIPGGPAKLQATVIVNGPLNSPVTLYLISNTTQMRVDQVTIMPNQSKTVCFPTVIIPLGTAPQRYSIRAVQNGCPRFDKMFSV